MKDKGGKQSAMRSIASLKQQKGAALLILLSVIILGATAVIVTQLNEIARHLDQDKKTTQALAQAKTALIGWAVSHPDRPGMLPFPDRNDDAGGYDGNSDCPSIALNNTFLVGQLPWLGQTAPCVTPHHGLGINATDAEGEHLWYAVSQNLVYNAAGGGYPTINSGIQELTTQWITILDENANILSDRVAAVIIAPGPALRGQDRSATSPDAANYLDDITVGADTYSNADADQIFISANREGNFNDRLIYITIDELIPLVERRIARKAKGCLDNYAAASDEKYPWAAQLDGSAAPDYVGDVGATFGRIPDVPNINTSGGTPPSSAQCAAALSTLQNPPCTHSPHAGPCLAALTTYASCPSCATVVPPMTATILGNPPCSGNPNAPACQTATAAAASCASGSGSNPDPAMQSTWIPADCFSAHAYWNDWKEEVLYQLAPAYQPGSSSDCATAICLTLNGDSDYRAMVLMAGRTLTGAGQQRAGNTDKGTVTNYLEGDNASLGDYSFERQKTGDAFNDQIACVNGETTCK